MAPLLMYRVILNKVTAAQLTPTNITSFCGVFFSHFFGVGISFEIANFVGACSVVYQSGTLPVLVIVFFPLCHIFI